MHDGIAMPSVHTQGTNADKASTLPALTLVMLLLGFWALALALSQCAASSDGGPVVDRHRAPLALLMVARPFNSKRLIEPLGARSMLVGVCSAPLMLCIFDYECYSV